MTAAAAAPRITPLRASPPPARIQPHNETAEQGLLGALLVENKAFADVSHLVAADDFGRAVHGRIYAAIGKLIAAGHVADPVTLKNHFDQDAALEPIGGGQYLIELARSAVTILNAPFYASAIRDCARRRRLLALSDELGDEAAKVDLDHDAVEISTRFGNLLAEIGNGSTANTLGAAGRSILDAGEDDAPIPPRGWLLGNTFCRGFISGLLAQGAGGKTALRLAQAMALATGRPLTGEHVFERCRVLIICLEDSIDELRRRVRAAMLHHDVSRDDLRGRFYLWAPAGLKIAEQRDGSRQVVAGELELQLRAFVAERGIDLILLDPLVKTHAVDENDNSAIDEVAVILAKIAGDLNCAVDVLHHERKAGAADAGDANRGRGASAFRDAARLVYTITPMTELSASNSASPRPIGGR